MADTIKNLRAYIDTRLKTLNNVDPEDVYDYEPNEIEGYPAVISNYDGMPEGEIITTDDNTRVIAFKIRIEQIVESDRGSGHNKESGEDVFINLLDEIITLFDLDVTLGGNCIKNSAVTGDAGFGQSPDNIRVGTINLNCLTLVQAGVIN